MTNKSPPTESSAACHHWIGIRRTGEVTAVQAEQCRICGPAVEQVSDDYMAAMKV